MQITNAKYTVDVNGNKASIDAIINGALTSVPLDPHNTEYAEILRQQSEGLLTIADAD